MPRSPGPGYEDSPALVRNDLVGAHGRFWTAEARAAPVERMGEAAMVDAPAVRGELRACDAHRRRHRHPAGRAAEEPTAHVREELGLGRFARA